MAYRCPPALQDGSAFMWPSPDSEHRGKPTPFRGQACMSDGVDTPVHAMEARGHHAAMDRLFSQPKMTKLID
jgi:hypothetical protein